MDEQQVSWLVVQPGWAIVAADGSHIGYVEELVGDEGKDIFDGIAVSTSLFEQLKYVPAESVGRIFQGRVELTVASNDVEQLEKFLEPPPSLGIEATKASWSNRLIEDVAPTHATAKRVPFRKRLHVWLLAKRRSR